MNKNQAFWAWLAHCAGHVIVVTIPLTVWVTMFVRGCLNNGSDLFLWCFPPIFPLLIMGVLTAALKAIQYWSVKRFEKVFGIQTYIPWNFVPDQYEKRVYRKLKEEALELGKKYDEIDAIYRTAFEIANPEEKNKMIKEAERIKYSAKKKFRNYWRLAKALGFSVFKSWKAHAHGGY